jgi:hypothetical protein
MAAKKSMVDGEIADKHFPLRTTETIYNYLLAESKGESVNTVINKILSRCVKRKMKTKKS